MHPAYSVIFFTTASGAGYGIWFLLGLWLAGGGAISPTQGVSALVLGGVLVTAGLLSSTAHLGHPERAWRALSQWRSSWLSREGVAAIATYIPAAAIMMALLIPSLAFWLPLFGVLLALSSTATVWCTGMIYASLRTVPEWNHGLVPAVYGALAAATGAILLSLILQLAPLAMATLALSALLKALYWRQITGQPLPFSIADALAIPGSARIRPLDPPHTQPNFVMREMGFVVGRKHAQRLRAFVWVLLFGVPMAALVLALWLPGASFVLVALAAVSAAPGVWIERWLFFAEARHLSMLYYPTGRADAEHPA